MYVFIVFCQYDIVVYYTVGLLYCVITALDRYEDNRDIISLGLILRAALDDLTKLSEDSRDIVLFVLIAVKCLESRTADDYDDDTVLYSIV